MAKILLLDDSRLVLAATKLALEADGHAVTSVDEPARFFAALSSEKPDLALVDVSMPGMEGDAVVWIARAHQLHACPILFYSAKSEAELKALAATSGVDGYICKTLDEDELRRKVKGFLAAR